MTNLQDPLLLPGPEWKNFDTLFNDMDLTEVIFELRALAQALLELNDSVILTDDKMIRNLVKKSRINESDETVKASL